MERMKLIYLLSYLGLLCVPLSLHAQDSLITNGFNLETYCSGEDCKYVTYSFPVHYPNVSHTQLILENFEIAIKENGYFLATGDLHVTGQDSAGIIQLELLFFSGSNEKLFSYKTDKFEFFNDADHAEPVMIAAEIPEELFPQVQLVDVEIRHSKKIPYYQVASNCFLPCKEVALKEAIKAFKKAK